MTCNTSLMDTLNYSDTVTPSLNPGISTLDVYFDGAMPLAKM